MATRRTMLRALSKRGKLVYGRIRVTQRGVKTKSERWQPFVSKRSARQLVSKSNRRFRQKGVRVKIIRFRKSSPY